MAAYDVILVLIQASLIHAISRSHMTIRLVSPENHMHSHAIHIEENLETIIARGICQGGRGNSLTFRLSPGDSGTDLLDENNAMTVKTEGAHSCMYATPRDRVSCKEENYCTRGNICNLTITAVCPAIKSKSSWLNTEAIDLTIGGHDGEVFLSGCITVCQSKSDDEIPQESKGLSELGIGFIVAGVIVGAALLVGGVIVWRIKQNRLPDEGEHKKHHIDYVE